MCYNFKENIKSGLWTNIKVSEEVKKLLNEVNAYKGDDILSVAACLHALFEFIHPFADGNGRVGRTIMNYYLIINDEPPLVIYEEDKNRYYDALVCYDESEDLQPLLLFLKDQTVKTWQSRFLKEDQELYYKSRKFPY